MRIAVFLTTLILLIAIGACVQPLPSPNDSGPIIAPASLDSGTGLTGAYFNSSTGTRAFTRTDPTIDFDWSRGSPGAQLGNDYYSAVWTGSIGAPQSGDYILSVRVDDGFRLYVNGTIVAESWKNQGGPVGSEPLYDSSVVHLSSTRAVPIRLEYYEAYSTAVVRVYWRHAADAQSAMTIVPRANLYPGDAATAMPENPAVPTGSNEPGSGGSSGTGGDTAPSSDVVIGPRSVASTPLSDGAIFASTSGSSSASCSRSDPCSITTAVGRASAGDVVFLRGGTYPISKQLNLVGTGSATAPITIESYPGERAIIDGGYSAPRLAVYGTYYVLRNLDVTRMSETGVYIGGNHNTLEGLSAYENHLTGFQIYSPYSEFPYGAHGSYNTISDCRAYDNSDANLSGGNYANGGNADGISISSGEGNNVTHCLVYGNSDDGIDTWRSTNSHVSYSVSHDNGLAAGDGNGFKAGGASPSQGTVVEHSISYDNSANGFDHNQGHNVVFRYDTSYGNSDQAFVWGSDNTVEHNIESNNGGNNNYGSTSLGTVSDNSWQRSGSVSFVSTDSSSSDFLRPTSGGGFEDIGAYAGLSGSANTGSSGTGSSGTGGSGTTGSIDIPTGSFRAQYYDDQDFTNLFATKTESSIDHDWGTGAPLSGMGVDSFSVRWEGNFDFPGGDTTFAATVDDGIRVYVDGTIVLESWKDQGATKYTATVPVSAGTHTIRVDYYDSTYNAVAKVSWAAASNSGTDGSGGTTPPLPSSTDFGARDVPRSKSPSAGDVFVSPDGKDSTCSQSAPCSLRTGVSRGGFIWLLDGTYHETSQLSVGSGKTLEALNPKQATIDFGGNDARVSLGDNNVLRNIVVQHAHPSSGGAIMVFGNHNLIDGVIAEYNYWSGFQTWPSTGYSDTANPTGGSYNTFRDCIGRFNNDEAQKCGGSFPCFDSDADGIGLSAGRGNVIDHFSAYNNTDDGIDIWASYQTTVEHSISHDNGYGPGGLKAGNGNGFKMGSGVDYAPVPNGIVVDSNWAYGNDFGADFTRNGGTGATFTNNVCGADQTACGPKY